MIRVITIGRNPPSKVLNKQPSLKAFNSLPIEKMTKEVPNIRHINIGKNKEPIIFLLVKLGFMKPPIPEHYSLVCFLQTNLVNFARVKEGNCTTSISNTIITASVKTSGLKNGELPLWR